MDSGTVASIISCRLVKPQAATIWSTSCCVPLLCLGAKLQFHNQPLLFILHVVRDTQSGLSKRCIVQWN